METSYIIAIGVSSVAIAIFTILFLFIIKTQIKIMATLQEFKDVIADIKVNTENIANDIIRLTDQLEVGGLTAAEETEVITEFRGVATRLKAIADATAEPAPPAEPTEKSSGKKN